MTTTNSTPDNTATQLPPNSPGPARGTPTTANTAVTATTESTATTAPALHTPVPSNLTPPTSSPSSYRPLGAARQLFTSRHQEILLAGPAGTGKTRAALEKLFLCMLKYPNLRALLVRKTRASITQSALVTLEEKVIPSNHPVLLGPSRSYRHSYVLPNGSELVIGGMDNVNRIMSSEYDIVLACEATELTLEDWEKLLSRLRNGIMPYQQAIAECNPSYPDHWLNARAAKSLMHRLISRHQDNPVYFNHKTNQWTPEGQRYIATLSRLSGVRRRRLLEGSWAAPEGLVYETFTAHLIPEIPGQILPATIKPRRACASIDWGWRDPAAVLIGVEATDGTIYIVDELYQSQLSTPQLMAHCNRMFQRWDVELCFVDRSRPEMMDLFRQFDIPCRLPKAENIETGIARVDSRLLSGKLKILLSCKSLIAEAARYQYLTDSTTTRQSASQTKPGPDHAMDSLRYLITGMEQTSDLDPLAAEAPAPLPDCSPDPIPDNTATQLPPNSPGLARGTPTTANAAITAPTANTEAQRHHPTFHQIWGD